MSDPQRTIDFLDDQIGRDQARWTALLAALDALVTEWNSSTSQIVRNSAARLAAEVATHREPR